MVLLTAVGLRKTFRLIIQYPGIIFIAIFSFWTVGPVRKPESKICCQLFKQEKLGISSKHTWINFSLSLGCSVATSVLLFFDQNVDKQNFILGWSVLVPMIMILLITLVSLLHGDSLNNFWCCCFQRQYYWCLCCKNCVATKYSVLNLATMEEDTEMQEIMNKTPNFEEQENGSHSRKHCINFSQLFMILLILLLVCYAPIYCLITYTGDNSENLVCAKMCQEAKNTLKCVKMCEAEMQAEMHIGRYRPKNQTLLSNITQIFENENS